MDGILWCEPDDIKDIPIRLQIRRANNTIFNREANASTMKRTLPELVDFLTRELDFPQGVFLMTGTSLVPDGDFTLQFNDLVVIQVGALTLRNTVRV